MSKAEKFIQDCTRSCSNELISIESRAGKEVISYNEWLNPEQARKAVELEREEMIEKACEWLKENKDKYLYNTGEKSEYIPTCSGKMIEDFKNYMEGE